jgi:deoxycytidine triphosphate deaminase
LYLSDGDLTAAIDSGQLIVKPFLSADPTSIDLHLDSVDQARIWDADKLAAENRAHGNPDRELRVGRMQYGTISRKYLIPPPNEKEAKESALVFKRDDQIVLKPGGFLLWQTKEVVGTPATNPNYICFIDGKSTRARTGLVVHLTAPTIHAGWSGNITLEMVNFGPLDLVLYEDDAVAQIVVAMISSAPQRTMGAAGSKTIGQGDVTGQKPSTN